MSELHNVQDMFNRLRLFHDVGTDTLSKSELTDSVTLACELARILVGRNTAIAMHAACTIVLLIYQLDNMERLNAKNN